MAYCYFNEGLSPLSILCTNQAQDPTPPWMAHHTQPAISEILFYNENTGVSMIGLLTVNGTSSGPGIGSIMLNTSILVVVSRGRIMM